MDMAAASFASTQALSLDLSSIIPSPSLGIAWGNPSQPPGPVLNISFLPAKSAVMDRQCTQEHEQPQWLPTELVWGLLYC